jgi:hypothetical protein
MRATAERKDRRGSKEASLVKVLAAAGSRRQQKG